MVALEPVAECVASAYDAAAGGYDAWHWSTFWNDHEVPVVTSLVQRLQPGTLVDAGCGTGRYRTVARTLARPYIGLDISSHMLAIGAAMLGGAVPGDRLMNADLRDTGLPDASAAIVLCARTLCHLPDPDTGFAELSRITERGGSLIISDLHPTFRVPVTRLPTPTGKIEVPTFRRTPEALVDCARQFGFACAERFDFAPGDGDAFFVLRLAHEG